MALKTFNVDALVYEKYSKHCRKKGISMSKQVESFLMKEIERIVSEDDSKVKEDAIAAPKLKEKTAVEHSFSKYCG